MAFVRDILTGKLEERPYSEPGIIARTTVPEALVDVRRRTGNPWSKDNLLRGISIPPEQATPERIERENAEARKHGTGVVYAPDGKCYAPTRGSRAKEFKRRNWQDNDACYSDHAGR